MLLNTREKGGRKEDSYLIEGLKKRPWLLVLWDSLLAPVVWGSWERGWGHPCSTSCWFPTPSYKILDAPIGMRATISTGLQWVTKAFNNSIITWLYLVDASINYVINILIMSFLVSNQSGTLDWICVKKVQWAVYCNNLPVSCIRPMATGCLGTQGATVFPHSGCCGPPVDFLHSRCCRQRAWGASSGEGVSSGRWQSALLPPFPSPVMGVKRKRTEAKGWAIPSCAPWLESTAVAC